MARQVVGRFYQGIRDHDYAKWVFDGHKDGTTGVQIALAAIVACAKAMSARQIHDPQGHGPKDASAVPEGDLPNTIKDQHHDQ